MPNWTANFSREAGKQYEKLRRSGTRPPIASIIGVLMLDLQKNGPHLFNWPNYGPLEAEHFHCHLRKGKSTYVACWRITDKKLKQIEVYYVGTHEGAPY